MSRRLTALRASLLGAVLLGHVGAFVAFGMIPKARRTTSVAIALAEAKKKREVEKEKKDPPKPPPVKAATKAPVAAKPLQAEPPPTPKAEPPPPAAPPKVGDAPEAMAGFADLGLQMGGDTGGIAVGGGGQGGPAAPARPAPSAMPVTKKEAKELAPVESAPCAEDIVKPKMLSQVQPAYTPEAQQAGVEGKVKLEVTIDATGHVTHVRVLNGLGFGLDESATAAVTRWTFLPAQKCGSAVPTTIKMGVSFGLK